MKSLTFSPAADRRGALGALAIALCCFGLVIELGGAVHAAGEPAALWALARATRGEAVGLAWALTQAVYPYVLGPIYLVLIGLGIARRDLRVRAFAVVFCGLAAWRIDDALQHLFARPRRIDWLVHHERSFSYPSSHAAIVAASFWLAAYLIWRMDAPALARRIAAAAVAFVGLGIVWSRLALGAHYPTDLAGGIVLGAAVVAAAEALLRACGRGLLSRSTNHRADAHVRRSRAPSDRL